MTHNDEIIFDEDKIHIDSIIKLVDSRYGIVVKSCELISSVETDIYKIQSELESYTVRITKTNNNFVNINQLTFQGKWLNFLKESINVDHPLKTSSSDYQIELDTPSGIRYLTVSPFISGTMISFDFILTEERASIFAKNLATIHKISIDYQDENIQNKNPGKILNEIYDFLQKKAGNEYYAYYIKHADLLKEKIEQSDKFGFQTIIWGDSPPFNALYTISEDVYFIDFDLAGRGSNLFDIASYLHNLIINNFDNKENITKSFINSYNSIIELNENDKDFIKDLMKLRHIQMETARGLDFSPSEKYKEYSRKIFDNL
ncbi:MAG: hypothetical protein OEY49_14890 [Candidatus Heimdallarchaeota archaeon]|nr:hypothetical protein [Candidatus Heimdallarchaeota archaeon]